MCLFIAIIPYETIKTQAFKICDCEIYRVITHTFTTSGLTLWSPQQQVAMLKTCRNIIQAVEWNVNPYFIFGANPVVATQQMLEGKSNF